MKLLLSLTAVSAVLLLIGSPVRAVPLPVANPGFEDGLQQTAWQFGTPGQPCMSPGYAPRIYDATVGDSTNVHSGRYSLELTLHGEVAWQVIQTAFPADCPIVLGAWIKMPVAGSVGTKVLTIQFNGLDSAGNCIWGRTSYPEFTGPYANWTWVSTLPFTSPSAVSRILIQINTQNGGGCWPVCSYTWYVDDVTLDTGCLPTPAAGSTWGRLKAVYHE